MTPGSWTTSGVAPATSFEVKVAAYLIVVAAFDDFVPEGIKKVPVDLAYFLDELKGVRTSDESLASAKAWMDITGIIPHFLNPVMSVMQSEHDLTLTSMEVYRWRSNMTAAASKKNRLASSLDSRSKPVSRLKTMLPEVAAFIVVCGPAEMFASLVAAREADPQSSERSPAKVQVKRKLSEVRCTAIF